MKKENCIRRRYSGPPGSQIHITESTDSDVCAPALFCLHATAYSGQTFLPFIEAHCSKARVLALDTPGYGGSDKPLKRLTICNYAAALIDCIEREAGDQKADLLGYHTGAIMAAEIARQRPDLIRRLILIGIPYFLGEARENWRKKLAEPALLTENLEQFRERWDYLVTNRPPSVSLPRGFANFIDELRAWPQNWWAHDAAFTFKVEECFPYVLQPTLVLNPQNHLSEASRHAARIMPNSSLIELPGTEHAVFDEIPEKVSTLISEYLMPKAKSDWNNPTA